MCETFNRVILEARSKPVTTMLEKIKRYAMQRIVIKINFSDKWKVNVGPNRLAKLEKEINQSVKWEVD